MLNFKKVNIISAILLLLLSFLAIENSISVWWILVLLVLWVTITTIGSFHIRANFFLKSKHSNYNIKQNAIALTFDDGPNPTFTPKVLQLLKEYNAKATFFCIGNNIDSHPKLVQKIISDGHCIGNHSYTHTNDYGFLPTKKIIADITKAQQSIKKVTNIDNQLFRPPFGVTNPNIAKAIKTLNLQSIGWSLRSYDTVAKDPNKVYKKLISKLKKGDVILLHDTSELSIIVLEQLLQWLQKNDIKTVTINQLFNINTNA